MKKIYAPWRHSYVADDVKGNEGRSLCSKDECVFCTQFAQQDDEKNLILQRYAHTVVVLNHYPYNAGHVMVLPREHKPDLSDLHTDERNELMEITTLCIEKIKPTLKPHGFNVGINLGASAGAGLPSHLHVHVVPRWNGDTNFMPILSDTKVISSNIHQVYQELRKLFTAA
jgi:ATP adenylyltransferase